MPKLTLQVRTHDNLLELLAQSESAAWIVAEEKVGKITHVQIVNFEGTQMIEAIFDRNASYKDDNRLVIKFLDGHVVNCSMQFDG
ncbi:MAG: hypothetical protein VKL39_14405 [Leptolyngbyaceae bacterium]|nr:hypothetical protein [Leptolyngbyaceae bacterium]